MKSKFMRSLMPSDLSISTTLPVSGQHKALEHRRTSECKLGCRPACTIPQCCLFLPILLAHIPRPHIISQ